MKKILTHLTGIVCLTTVLAVGGCTEEPGPRPPGGNDNVKIYCKAFEVSGVLNFVMYDSNTDTKEVAKVSKADNSKLVANLTTDVEPGAKVTWIWTTDSEIRKFVKIGPPTPGQIIPHNARRVFFTKKRRLRIPNNAPNGQESYYIEFKDINGNIVTVDPYLRIR